MFSNNAAWLTKAYGKLEVKPAPYTPPGENEMVVKNHAVAINPVDWYKQRVGNFIFSWVKYPFILGGDVAGEIVEVGKRVQRFKVGDRVLAQALGMDRNCNRAAEGAFQQYTVVRANLAAPIPDNMSYERAVVLPLTLATAACGLFQKDHLALEYPSVPPKPTGKSVLIWGGSTSVGSNGIQLAVSAGYDVITTASPRNFDYVRKLGASQVFDYNSPAVVQDIIKALKGQTIAGALAIGAGSTDACLDIVHNCEGNKFVSMASAPIGFEAMPDRPGFSFKIFPLVLQLLRANASLRRKSRRRHVQTNFIDGGTIANNEVSRVIYEQFLPRALAEGQYIAAPDPYVVGRGLEYIQEGLDLQRKGVSAKKVVITL